MYTNQMKYNSAPAVKRVDMVGMEGAWPELFWVMGNLGFVLPKRHPSGPYRPSWVRLIPIVTITPLMCWYILRNRNRFTDISYDKFVNLISGFTCTFTVAFTSAMAIYKRRETCILFEALDGKLKPPGTWLSLARALLFILNFGLLLLSNYIAVITRGLAILDWFITTLIHPVLPLLVDLYIACSIGALNQVYDGMLNKILRRSEFSLWTLGSVEEFRSFSSPVSSGFFDKFQNGQQAQKNQDLDNVDAILHHLTNASHLVDLHNQVYSSWTLMRCGALLMKLLDSSYYVILHFGIWDKFAGAVLYFINEVGSFLFLCRQADLLKENDSKLKGVLLTLQQHPSTPLADRLRLLSFSLHFKSRPAYIAIGSVGALGSHVLFTMLNVGLTFTAILYQYRPASMN